MKSVKAMRLIAAGHATPRPNTSSKISCGTIIVDIDIAEGQFYTLLGPSGCGKTTTLRSIAGLETPTGGVITIDGATMYSAASRVNIPPHRRDIGMVFQSYAIWPHMTVFENVAFPLREMPGRRSKSEIGDRVRKALALVQLEGYEERPAP